MRLPIGYLCQLAMYHPEMKYPNYEMKHKGREAMTKWFIT